MSRALGPAIRAMEITFHAMNKTKRNFEKYSESVLSSEEDMDYLRVAASDKQLTKMKLLLKSTQQGFK
jgi:hypothetical protein